MKLFAVAVAVCFCFGAGGGPVSFRAVKGEEPSSPSSPSSPSVFVLGRAGGQSALEFGVKLFAVAVAVVVVAVCFCFGAGGGPVSFGVWCETVRRRRRRLFLFWGGRGASQLWSLV